MAALFAPGVQQFRSIVILILVGAATWLLTNTPPEPKPKLQAQPQPESPSQPSPQAPQQPALTSTFSQPALETPAQIEYKSLAAFFDQLVRYSLLAIGTILAVAGALLWKSTGELQGQAAASIKATQDSANIQISAIGTTAQDTARSETKKAVSDALENSNLQRMIQDVARARVNEAVDAAAQQFLEPRIDAIRILTVKIGEVSSYGAQLRMEFRDGLEGLLKFSKDPDPTIRAYAHSTLAAIAADYESTAQNSALLPADLPPKSLMGVIRGDRQPPRAPMRVAEAFIKMKKKFQWDVQTFDIPAAEKWCAQHKPKCDE